jgi:transcriptional regulator with XRE-family HTH domain
MNVGAQLRQARESRGLSIAALAATTRINPRTLDGLERNDLSGVPSGPYARGFVAAFAREVGLSPTETVRAYFAQFAEAPVVLEDKPNPSTVRVDLFEENQWRQWMLAAAVVALVVTGGLLLTPRAETPGASEPAAVGTSGAAARPELTPAGSVSPGATSVQPRRDVALPTPKPADGAIAVVLEAERPSWVTATVDGKRQVYQLVTAGTTTSLRGREIAIRVGDAGAIRWSIDGRQAMPMGSSGQVRDVRITPDTAGAIR